MTANTSSLLASLRALPALTSASAAMYGASAILLLIGFITWVPERNPRWVLGSLAVVAFGLMVWTLGRGRRFSLHEALAFMAVQLAITGVLSWNTHQQLGALANGTSLPIIGVYAVWFLRRPVGRLVFYAGVAWWFIALWHHRSPELTGFGFALVVQTVFATEVFVRIKRRMDSLVRTDPLTGTLNLRGVTEALRHEISRAVRRGSPLSVVSIDLDGLRALNNTRGHRAGDDMLQAVTDHWRRTARDVDVIGRTGGDEFLMLLPDTSKDAAEAIVARLAVGSPGQWSAGVAEVKPGDTLQALLERADQRMYVSKAARKTTVKLPD